MEQNRTLPFLFGVIMSSRYGKLIKNTLIFLGGSFTVKLSQFLVMPILTGAMTAAEYGTAELLSNISDLIVPIITLGIPEALFRFSIDNSNDPVKIFTSGFFIITIGTAASFIITFIIGFFYFEKYLIALPFLFLSVSFKKLFQEFIRGRGRTAAYAAGGIIEASFLLISACVFILILKLGALGYVLSLITGAAAAGIYFVILLKPRSLINKSAYEIKLTSRMLRFSVPAIPNTLSWWIVQISNRYILTFYNGLAAAGLFMAASKLPALVNIIGSVFLQAWSLSSSENKDGGGDIGFYASVLKYYKAFVTFATVAVIILSPYISIILLRGEFYQAYVYTPFLILSAGIGCLSSYFGAFFTAYYKTGYGTVTTFCGAAVNIALSFALIPVIGVYGAIAASASGYTVILFTRIIAVRRLVKFDSGIIKMTAGLFFAAVAAALSAFNITGGLYWSLAVLIIVFAMYFKEAAGVIKKFYSALKRKKDEI